MDPNNSLGFNLRAPKSVPYVLPWKMSKHLSDHSGRGAGG